jgi:hypothetical protein
MFWKKYVPNRALRWAVLGTFLVMVLVNGLANFLPIGGNTTAQVSDAYPNLFAPMGFTFSLWGVIYTLLGAYALRQLGLFSKKKPITKEVLFDRIAPYVIASSVLNTLWIFAWHYRLFALSVLLIIGLLICLVQIVNRLRTVKLNARDIWLVRAPFSVYFGWITVATIANITTWLVSTGWDGWGLRPGVWMVAVLLVGTVIGVTATARNRDWLYGAVIVWAFAGILAKHLSSGYWNGQYPSVLATLYIVLPVLIITTLYYAKHAIRQLER